MCKNMSLLITFCGNRNIVESGMKNLITSIFRLKTIKHVVLVNLHLNKYFFKLFINIYNKKWTSFI